jgi:hypothetical protein
LSSTYPFLAGGNEYAEHNYLPKYVMHANVLPYFKFVVTFAVIAYLFKYFKYVEG